MGAWKPYRSSFATVLKRRVSPIAPPRRCLLVVSFNNERLHEGGETTNVFGAQVTRQ